MPNAAGALKLSIDLMHLPSQVRSVRSAPLPDDVQTLLRIAAGDQEAISQAAKATGNPNNVLREAAAFYVEQILLHPGADSYRVLGATPEAPYLELRRNMALLLRWLHPDRDREDQRAVFAARVTRAWNDVKTKERRAAYDQWYRMSIANEHRKKRGARTRSSGHGPSRRPRFGGAYGRPIPP